MTQLIERRYGLQVGGLTKWPADQCTMTAVFTHKGPAETIYLAWGLAVANIENAFPNKIVWIYGSPGGMIPMFDVSADATERGYSFGAAATMPPISAFVGISGAVPNSVDCYMVISGSLYGSLVGEYDRVSDVYSMVEPSFGPVAFTFS